MISRDKPGQWIRFHGYLITTLIYLGCQTSLATEVMRVSAVTVPGTGIEESDRIGLSSDQV